MARTRGGVGDEDDQRRRPPQAGQASAFRGRGASCRPERAPRHQPARWPSHPGGTPQEEGLFQRHPPRVDPSPPCSSERSVVTRRKRRGCGDVGGKNTNKIAVMARGELERRLRPFGREDCRCSRASGAPMSTGRSRVCSAFCGRSPPPAATSEHAWRGRRAPAE
jgi:hypothetical protein